jgi:hypothetical protein
MSSHSGDEQTGVMHDSLKVKCKRKIIRCNQCANRKRDCPMNATNSKILIGTFKWLLKASASSVCDFNPNYMKIHWVGTSILQPRNEILNLIQSYSRQVSFWYSWHKFLLRNLRKQNSVLPTCPGIEKKKKIKFDLNVALPNKINVSIL